MCLVVEQDLPPLAEAVNRMAMQLVPGSGASAFSAGHTCRVIKLDKMLSLDLPDLTAPWLDADRA